MKLRILLLLLCVTLQNYSQVSVGSRHVGKSVKFDKEVLEKFKNTETIFVLSSIYDKEVYEEILHNSWFVTPYRIVNAQNFKIEDYLNDKYSIAQVAGFKRIKQMKSGSIVVSLFTYIDIKIYDSEKIFEELNKLAEKKKSGKNKKKKAEKMREKERDIIDENSSNIARFYIFPKDDFIHTALSSDMDTIVNSMLTEDVFYNYKPGLLKNYFQKVNNLLEKEEEYWMYENDYEPELKNLSTSKLYIPSYMTIKYNGWTMEDSEKDDENIHELFKAYDFEYEIIDEEDLSDRILENEEFYYLRYVRMNAERFLQIVNSKSGEIIYRNYITGFSYKLKVKNVKYLNSKIIKASKN